MVKERRSDPGDQLALTMADMCARSGDLMEALRHLEAHAGHRKLPRAYAQRHRDWLQELGHGDISAARARVGRSEIHLPSA